MDEESTQKSHKWPTKDGSEKIPLSAYICGRIRDPDKRLPFIVARLLCCLFVDLIWRNLLYIPVERGDLIQSLLQFRRLRVRCEKRAEMHEAFLSLGCALICWRCLRGFQTAL
jgi:hypothetical protein